VRTAEAIAHGRDNNFNLIRMVAASAVIVAHSYALSLGPGRDVLIERWIYPLDLGSAAVRVFFVISGFFIFKSFDRRASIYAFTAARVGRLLPALLLVSSATTLAIGAGFVGFAHNPYPFAPNGSLWTLKYEIICYIVLAIAGLCGLFDKGRFPAFLIGVAMVYAAIKSRFLPLPLPLADLSLPFVLGMAAYQYRRLVPLSGYVAAPLVAIAYLCRTDAIWSLALGYCAFWIGARFEWLRPYNRLGDYSYGTYIFAWPVQQMTAMLIVGVSPVQMMLVAMPATWALGIISWHLIERPAMRFATSARIGSPPIRRRSFPTRQTP
jgi:peptidoglycan/LPS O-acetylase OafA/YrhL